MAGELGTAHAMCKICEHRDGATDAALLEIACCGHGRWCPNCCYFYEALTECANPHLVRNGVMVLLQQLAASTPDASLFDVNRLPEHLCTDNCTGFALPV